jgi:hypothetical protein
LVAGVVEVGKASSLMRTARFEVQCCSTTVVESLSVPVMYTSSFGAAWWLARPACWASEAVR